MSTDANSLRTRATVLLMLWTGLFAQAYGFAGGTGEPNDPYRIATAEQLICIGSDPNLLDKCFVLVADIDLDPNLADGRLFTRAVIAPGTLDVNDFPGTTFTGYFDGRSHTIEHLTIRGTGPLLGLFGKIGAGARVHDLRLENILVDAGDGSRYLGALAGYIERCTITNCVASARVTGGANAEYLGGFVGLAWYGGRIMQCFASAGVHGGDSSESLGGMVGANGGAVINCHAKGSVSGADGCKGLGGLVGRNGATLPTGSPGLYSRGRIIHCYTSSIVYGGDSGDEIGGLVGGDHSSCTTGSFWDVEASGLPASGGGVGLITAEMQDVGTFAAAGWDLVGERANGTADPWLIPEGGGYPMLAVLSDAFQARRLDGNGTLDDPHRIASAEDLGAVWHHDPFAHYRLTADIDLSGIIWATAPVCGFEGRLNGADFVVSNLTIRGESYLGLFDILAARAEVSNLGIEDVNIVGEHDSECVGGLAGWNDGRIANCRVGGSVAGGDCLGGLVGYNGESGTINDSCADGAVVETGRSYFVAGGLVGLNRGTIANSHACVELTGDNHILGGLVGRNGGDISGCYATGWVVGDYHLGGLVACNAGTISNSYAMVSIHSSDISPYAGGLIGANGGTVANCYAVAAILNESVDDSYSGGLIGSNVYGLLTGTVVNSFWDTDASGLSDSAGGIGRTTAQMEDPSTFLTVGWDFDTIWMICEGRDYPRLRWENVRCEE